MAWKFFHIGKANEEITRLETEVASRDRKISDLEGQLKAVAEGEGAVAAAATDLQTKLDAAQAQIKALEAERDQLKKDLAASQQNLEAEKASVEKKAAAKALEITGRQGQVPIKVDGQGAATDTGDLESKIKATDDPYERTRIFRKHRAAIISAAEAQKNKPRN